MCYGSVTLYLHSVMNRTQRICTANVCALSGAVPTVTSTCLSRRWSACSTRAPAGQLGNSRPNKVRSHSVLDTITFSHWWAHSLKDTNCTFVLRFSEAEAKKTGSSSASSLSRVYHCDVCNEDLTLTSTEILKHKRQHMYAAK